MSNVTNVSRRGVNKFVLCQMFHGSSRVYILCVSRRVVYITSVEYLSRGAGVHHVSGMFIQTGGGGCTTLVEYLSTGACTPPQWNMYLDGWCT